MKLSLIHKADWLKSSPHMNVFGQKQQRQIFPLPSFQTVHGTKLFAS